MKDYFLRNGKIILELVIICYILHLKIIINYSLKTSYYGAQFEF